MPHVHLTPTLSCVSIPSVMHEEDFASIMEHSGAYATVLHALVKYHIPTTLPMQNFHNITCFADKDENITTSRIQTGTANLAAHAVDTYSHVTGVLRHHYSIALI